MIFRNFVLKNFPFLEDDFDALTDYELFCKMVEYMKKSLEHIESYDSQFVDFNNRLSAMENYFNNLDVQEEINNKLDEMAENGELTDIIAQYLGLAGLLTFNNVDDMKTANNLVNGSITKTLGYSTIQDNGGGYYKIRNITNDDVVDDVFIISLYNENLVAELIIPTKININLLGGTEDTDISDILQSAINKDNIEEIDLLNNSYLITNTITLKSNFLIKNGNITSDEISNIFEGTNLNNIIIDNIEFNGNNTCKKGIYLTNINNFKITNCKFHDFEVLNASSCGINTHSCKFGLISNCEAYDIGNNSTGTDSYEPRGFIIENSTNIEINKCYVHDIFTTDNHGDGIQFLSPVNRDISKNIVRDSVIQDCIYRGLKLQQRGVIIDNCKIIEGTNDRTLQQSAIAVYDSDITIQNSYISQKCNLAITIGTSTDITTVANNVTIQNNIFIFKNSVSYGVIAVPNLATMVENLNIINNKFDILDESKKPFCVHLLGKFNNVNVANNVYKGGETFLKVQKASNDNEQNKQNLIVIGNTGTNKQSLVTFDENVVITNGSITGNNAYYDTPLDFVSGQNSVRVFDVTLYKTFKIGNNHISSSNSGIYFYDGARNIGATTARPTTAVNNGFQFFDTTLHQIVTFYNNNWYLPDGTISS